MKKVFKVTALSLGLACAASAMADDNIAFVNTDYLLMNHPARQLELKKLDAEFKAPIEKLQASEKNLQTKKAAFEKEIDDKLKALEKDAKKLRQAEIKKRQDEITQLAQKRDGEYQALVADHQKEAAKFQQDVRKRDMEVAHKLLDEIKGAVTQVAKAKKYTVVLEEKTAIYAEDGKNITKEVLQALPVPAK